MPKRATAIKPEPTTIKKKKRNTTKLVLPDSPLTLVINLKRRVDRLRKLRSVLREGGLTKWERIDAVDGAFLTWEEVSKYISVKALNDARTAEMRCYTLEITRDRPRWGAYPKAYALRSERGEGAGS